MPTTSLSIALVPTEETFTPHIDEIIARLGNMLPAWESAYAAFLEIEARRFGAEGPGWEPLAPSTVAERTRLGYGGAHPILVREGILKDSLTREGAAHAVFQPEGETVFMGTSDPVAGYHQGGTSRMPARAVVDMTEADAVAFAGIIEDHVFGASGSAVTVGGALFTAGALGL